MHRICNRAFHSCLAKLAQVSNFARSLNKIVVLSLTFFLRLYAQVLAQRESFKITSKPSLQ